MPFLILRASVILRDSNGLSNLPLNKNRRRLNGILSQSLSTNFQNKYEFSMTITL